MPLTRIQRQARGSGRVLHALDNLASIVDRQLARRQSAKDKTVAQKYAEELWFRQQSRIHEYRKELAGIEAGGRLRAAQVGAQGKLTQLNKKQMDKLLNDFQSFEQWKKIEPKDKPSLYIKDLQGNWVPNNKDAAVWNQKAFTEYINLHYNPYMTQLSRIEGGYEDIRVSVIANRVADIINKNPGYTSGLLEDTDISVLAAHPSVGGVIRESATRINMAKELDQKIQEKEAQFQQEFPGVSPLRTGLKAVGKGIIGAAAPATIPFYAGFKGAQFVGGKIKGKAKETAQRVPFLGKYVTPGIEKTKRVVAKGKEIATGVSGQISRIAETPAEKEQRKRAELILTQSTMTADDFAVAFGYLKKKGRLQQAAIDNPIFGVYLNQLAQQ